MLGASLILAAAGLFPAFQPGPTAISEPLMWETPVSWSVPARPRPGPAFSPDGAKLVDEARRLGRESGPAAAAARLKGASETPVRLVRADFLRAAGDLAGAQAEYERVLQSDDHTAPRALALAGYKDVLRRRIAAGEKALYQPLVESLKREWLNEEALDLIPAILADAEVPAETLDYVRKQEPVLALRLGRFDRAVELWANARERSERQWLAQAEQRRGNFARAAELRLDLAEKTAPGRARQTELQAAFDFLAKGGLFTEAKALAEKYPELKKTDDFEWRMGLAALAVKDPSAATWFRAVLDDPQTRKSNDRRPGARYFLGRALETAGLKSEARAAYAGAAAGPFGYYRLLAQGRLAPEPPARLAGGLARLLQPGPPGRDRDSLGYHLWITEKGFSREDLEEIAESLSAEIAEPANGGKKGGLHDEALRLLAARDWWELGRLLRRNDALTRAPHPALAGTWPPLAATAVAWCGDYRRAVSLFSRVPSRVPGLMGWSHPLVYGREARAAYRERNLSPALLLALIRTESAFQADVISASNARGLMQLLPATASKIAAILGDPDPGPTDLFNPELNIRYGSWYLRALIRGFGSEPLALAGYNGGPYNIKSLLIAKQGFPLDVFIETLTFEETSRYVRRILESRCIYETVYLGRSTPPDLTAPVAPPNDELPAF